MTDVIAPGPSHVPGHSARSHAVAHNPHHARRWAILAVLATAQLMVVLDTTVVNIALPSAQKSLGFSNGDRQWVVTAYALAFGSLLLLGGRLADLFGRKSMFLIGLTGFAIASAVGGASNGFEMLVVSRAVQGAFGALLAPAGLSLLTTTFTDSKERGKAFGIYGAIAGGGAALGLLLGGFLTEYLSWRWCMYINLIFAVGAAIGGFILLVHQKIDEKPKIDIPGVLTATAGLFSVVYGFSHAETGGWANAETLSFLGAGVILLSAFVAIQARTAHPLLPLRILDDRNRAGALLSILMSSAGMFGVFLFLTYYLQESLGYSSVRTGVSFLPMSAAIIAMSTFSSQVLARRIGPKFIVAPGLLIAAGGLVLLARIKLNSSYASTVLPATVVIGLGVGMVFASAISLATMGVETDDAGVASALVSTGQQIGGSIGTALLNTLAASATTSYLLSHGKASALVIQNSQIHGYVVAFYWSAAIFAVGSVVCALLLQSKVVVPPEGADAIIAL